MFPEWLAEYVSVCVWVRVCDAEGQTWFRWFSHEKKGRNKFTAHNRDEYVCFYRELNLKYIHTYIGDRAWRIKRKWSKWIRWSVVFCLFFAFSRCRYVLLCFCPFAVFLNMHIACTIFLFLSLSLAPFLIPHIIRSVVYVCDSVALLAYDNWYELFGTWHKTVMRAYSFQGSI